MLNKESISYLVLSDVHLGHKKNTTTEIIENLNIYFEHFNKKSIFSKIDVIFIAGDLFDSLLSLADTNISEIFIFIYRLSCFCSKNKIKLRILEGTPSHDWGQSFILNIINKVSSDELDAKYVDTLSIEDIDDLGLSVLYVPDEWTNDPKVTFKQVTSIMKTQKKTKVDICIMHGCFNYQINNLPGNFLSHTESDYLGITNYFISIGHFHSFSVFDRIICQGSFDRLAHNEEEPKGGVLLTIGNNPGFVFIENKKAKTYLTLDIDDKKTLSKTYKTIYNKIKDLRKESNVRLRVSKKNPLYSSLRELKEIYPFFNFSRVSKEDEETKLSNIKIGVSKQNNTISITKDNIVSSLKEIIENKYSVTKEENVILEDILKKTNNSIS